MVSAQLLEHGDISVRELLAMEVNKYFKVGTTTSSLPVHLHGYLTTPDDQLPLSQNIEWKQDNDDNYFASPASKAAVSGQTVTRDLSAYIPGVNAVVECPCETPSVHNGQIISLVQHLNDSCGYTREQVADWLESLDIDLTFPSEPPAPRKLPRANRDERLVILGTTLAAVDHEIRRRRRNPKDVIGVSAHQGHRVISERLMGLRDFQYVVLPGTYVHDEVAALLQINGGREVGDEEPDPAWSDHLDSMQYAMKSIWAKQIEYQLEAPLYLFKAESQLVELKFTKAPVQAHIETKTSEHVFVDSLSVIQNQLGKYIAQWYDKTVNTGWSHHHFVFDGAPKGYELLGSWKDEAQGFNAVLDTQAAALMKNLEALKGSEHADDVLWLADPKILGEHLPAVKAEPTEQQGGHALLLTGDSAWTKFTKPDWKKDH
jgi:hypothetical protein